MQLLRLFRLDEFPTFTKPIDPSLYLHRFVDRLKLGDKKVVGWEGILLNYKSDDDDDDDGFTLIAMIKYAY